jgi:D-alanine-D-alanine ligase-like ATP-grasp enzyme
LIVGCAVVMQRSGAADEADFTSAMELDDISGHLRSMGHTAVAFDVSDPLGRVIEEISSARPDVMLNTTERIRGEVRPSGAVPTICGLLGIPCTGPDARSMAVGADKWLTKRTIPFGTVRFAPDLLLAPDEVWDPSRFDGPYPVLVKPNFGGSSQGIGPQSLARSPDQVEVALRAAGDFRGAGLLVESFISGQDVTVGCVEVDGTWRVLAPLRYRTPETNGEHFLTQSLKTWAEWDTVRYEPAELTDAQRVDVETFAHELVRAVGARGVARIDFRLSETDGLIYALEINAIADIQSEAGVSRSAEASGMAHPEMLGYLLASAGA